MLKVQINKNEFKSDLVPIRFDTIESEEMFYEFDDGTLYDADETVNLTTVYHDNSIDVNVGDRVVCKYTLSNSDDLDETYTKEYSVSGVDNSAHLFTFLSDRYVDFEPDVLNFVQTSDYDEDTDEHIYRHYIYLYINRYHFLGGDVYPTGVTVFTKNNDGVDIELVCEPFEDKCIRFPLDEIELPDCTGIDDEGDLAICNEISADIELFNQRVKLNRIFAKTILKYYNTIYSEDIEWEEIINMLFSNNVETEYYPARPFDFRQYNFMFEDTTEVDRLKVYAVKPNVSISIPLSVNAASDLNQETNVNEKFVEVEKRKAINPYVEMEKDVYSPVFSGENGFERVTELHFNLHFRQREGDDWKVIRTGSWNGVRKDGDSIILMGKSNEDRYGYFSYADDESSQSDLLTYLNFSDSDVKYRKNTLKKSFLRLSYFDSTMPTNQNLLCYSTVFVDTGNLFSKYMRNFDNPKKPSSRFGFSRMIDGGESMKGNLSGSRVNREPYWPTYPDDVNEVEQFRLSSQFVVKDKYSSDSCSEGFYLYLWKDYNNGNVPSDIYMRVEFNHAGFGRTIPFMMPYDKSSGAIKKFDEIAEDDGYGVKEYIRYSYIHFKYMQDSNGKYVYYLDDNQYKSNISFKDGVLSLNLYEAKLYEVEPDEGD